MKNEKSETVKHVAEATRHFARYKIPAFLEIDGKRYLLDDWSTAGCGIKNLPDEVISRKTVIAHLVCPFDNFETTIKNIKVELLHKNEKDIVGGRFTEVKPDQLSLMQEIIGAYLEGNILNIDGLINTVRREDLKESMEKRRPKGPGEGGLEDFFRKIFIFVSLLGIVVLLVYFLLKSFYYRVYNVEALSSYFDANLTVIRSNVDGVIKEKNIHGEGKRIEKDDLVGIIDSVTTLPVVVSSPVSGTVYRANFEPHSVILRGDALVSIIPDNESIYVTANILHKDLKRVFLGQSAKITTHNGEVIDGIIYSIDAAPEIDALHKLSNDQFNANTWIYDRLKIKLKRPIPLSQLNTSVSVEIDSAPKTMEPLFKIVK